MVRHTLASLGTLQALLNKSSDANFVRLITNSKEGPISSSSTRGIWHPEFLRMALTKKIFLNNNNPMVTLYILQWITQTLIMFKKKKKISTFSPPNKQLWYMHTDKSNNLVWQYL